jgi:hypothetical protein
VCAAAPAAVVASTTACVCTQAPGCSSVCTRPARRRPATRARMRRPSPASAPASALVCACPAALPQIWMPEASSAGDGSVVLSAQVRAHAAGAAAHARAAVGTPLQQQQSARVCTRVCRALHAAAAAGATAMCIALLHGAHMHRTCAAQGGVPLTRHPMRPSHHAAAWPRDTPARRAPPCRACRLRSRAWATCSRSSAA